MTARLRDIGKRLSLRLLSVSGVIGLSQYLSRRHIVVLTYHRVIPRSTWSGENRPPNTLFTDEFDAQMAYVARHFNALAEEELKAVLQGSRPVRDYSLVVTFDDGYENNFTHALPILQRHGLRAVFFVTTNLIGNDLAAFWFDRLDQVLGTAPFVDIQRTLLDVDPSLDVESKHRLRAQFKRLSHERQSELLAVLEKQFDVPNCAVVNPDLYRAMNWDQVRELSRHGMTIGSHTENHQILSAVDPEQAYREVLRSRERIEAETGCECWCFGYPNGQWKDFRESDQLALRQAGYQCAFTQVPGTLSSSSPRFTLPRIPIPDVGDLMIFRSHVSGINRALSVVRGS